MAARSWVAGLLVISAILAFAESNALDGEKRIALVIGNGRYSEAPLNNPANDARGITRVLRSLGFEVLSHENLDFLGMRRAVVEFGESMSEGGVSLFYYSGHGLQVGGRNYLVPIAARLTSERYIAAETLELDAVLKEMDAARNRLNIVVLDACRDNPFARGWRSTSRGLAQVSGPPGTFIAYATDPGDVAADGAPGTNGVYTAELLKSLPVPGLAIEEVFKRTARGVIDRTRNRQRPWVSSSFTGDFQFVAEVSDRSRPVVGAGRPMAPPTETTPTTAPPASSTQAGPSTRQPPTSTPQPPATPSTSSVPSNSSTVAPPTPPSPSPATAALPEPPRPSREVKAQGPADEEAAVRKVLADARKAFNKDDVTTYLSYFADDAQIDSKIHQAKVSKPQYAEAVGASMKQGNIISSETRDVRVMLVDPTHATVLSTIYVITKSNRFIWPLEWRLEKRDGRWLIVETSYK